MQQHIAHRFFYFDHMKLTVYQNNYPIQSMFYVKPDECSTPSFTFHDEIIINTAITSTIFSSTSNKCPVAYRQE